MLAPGQRHACLKMCRNPACLKQQLFYVEEGQGEAEEEEEEGRPASSRRRRRGAQKKGLEELRADWAWLDDMNPEDRPWLFFGLYRALYSTV